MFKCKHCHIWKKEDNFNVVPLKIWLNFLDDVKNLFKKNIEINLGGEGMVLLDEKIFPIISKSKNLGFYILLNSNGYLINKLILNKLLESGVDKISISLDFLSGNKHDKQKGIDGCFNHIINLIKNIETINQKSKLFFNCVIMKQNLEEIIPLTKWINSLGFTIGFQAIAQPFNSPDEQNWFNKDKFKFLWPGNDLRTYEIIDKLITLKKKGHKIGNDISQLESYKFYFKKPNIRLLDRCNVDEVGFHIYADGIVKRCQFKYSLGTIKDNKFGELLKSNEYITTLNSMYSCSENCMQMVNCSFKNKPKIY